MEFRKLTNSDMEDSIKLSQFAFQYTLNDEERLHRLNVMRPEDSIGVYSDGELLAKLTTLPFLVQINDVDFKMGGVSGVATYPEYRRNGLVKKLLQLELKEMKDKEQSLSYLYPFSVPFYRKYGWELIVDYQKLTLTREQLPRFQHVNGSIKKITEDSIGTLNDIYTKYARNYNGMLKRDENWWRDWVLYRKKGRMVVYYTENSEPKGYIIYEAKERKMTVKEFIALDDESRKGIWNFISNHDSMADEYVIEQFPLNEPYPYWLPDPKIKKEVIPYFMARIVDVEQFLNLYPFQNEEDFTLFLHISDDFAIWNAATFQLTAMKPDKVMVRKYPTKNKGTCQYEPKRGISCDIKDLTTMLLNYQSPTQLLKIQRIKGSREEIELLERIIVKKPTAFIDFF
ncbi:enhanced intracellular survival protein Eis [Alkalihalobacillus sp. BA299]|uniref:GNAT family N-acetyltransferase n=1 Tax=Alkalihalobacillus sp. BA299 TaxID=2815938 RepID=UPI001ADB794E|nr:GNAT family N-acetyltransferase [Alkalihalobacillus sp. BA299]